MTLLLDTPTTWPTRSNGLLAPGLVTGPPASGRTRHLAAIAAHAEKQTAPTRVWAVSPRGDLPTRHAVWAETGGTDIHRHLVAVIAHRAGALDQERWGGEPCYLYPQLLVVADDLEHTAVAPTLWADVLTRGPQVGVVLIAATGTDPAPELAGAAAHRLTLEADR